jgi:hypothetical protein
MTSNANARAIALALIEGGMTKAQLGREIGYERATVSRWINEPDYNGTHIEAAVLERFSRFACPHLKADITPAQCASYALRPCPTCNAREVRHWKSCQTCPNKPESKEGESKC